MLNLLINYYSDNFHYLNSIYSIHSYIIIVNYSVNIIKTKFVHATLLSVDELPNNIINTDEVNSIENSVNATNTNTNTNTNNNNNQQENFVLNSSQEPNISIPNTINNSFQKWGKFGRK